jgi:hypothetical protein
MKYSSKLTNVLSQLVLTNTGIIYRTIYIKKSVDHLRYSPEVVVVVAVVVVVEANIKYLDLCDETFFKRRVSLSVMDLKVRGKD